MKKKYMLVLSLLFSFSAVCSSGRSFRELNGDQIDGEFSRVQEENSLLQFSYHSDRFDRRSSLAVWENGQKEKRAKERRDSFLTWKAGQERIRRDKVRDLNQNIVNLACLSCFLRDQFQKRYQPQLGKELFVAAMSGKFSEFEARWNSECVEQEWKRVGRSGASDDLAVRNNFCKHDSTVAEIDGFINDLIDRVVENGGDPNEWKRFSADPSILKKICNK